MQNFENLDVFEILITQKLLKCPKDPFLRSALIYILFFCDHGFFFFWGGGGGVGVVDLFFLGKCVDSDEMPHFAIFHLVIYCFPMYEIVTSKKGPPFLI